MDRFLLLRHILLESAEVRAPNQSLQPKNKNEIVTAALSCGQSVSVYYIHSLVLH